MSNKILNIEIAIANYRTIYFALGNIQMKVLPGARAKSEADYERVLYRFPKYLHHKTKDIMEALGESRKF